MENYTDILVVFSLAVIALAVLQSGTNWILGVAAIFLVVNIWLVKASVARPVKNEEEKSFIDLSNQLDSISHRIEDLRKEIYLSAFASSQKIEDLKKEYLKTLDTKYRELARKIFDVENKMNRNGKNTLFALEKLEERINSINELLGIFETEKGKRAG